VRERLPPSIIRQLYADAEADLWSNSFISGSIVLQCFYGETYPRFDIDMYISKERPLRFRDYQVDYTHDPNRSDNQNYIVRKSNCPAELYDYHPCIPESGRATVDGITINIIKISEGLKFADVFSKFDITVCQCALYVKKGRLHVYFGYMDHLIWKDLHITEGVRERTIIERVTKYMSRGYRLSTEGRYVYRILFDVIKNSCAELLHFYGAKGIAKAKLDGSALTIKIGKEVSIYTTIPYEYGLLDGNSSYFEGMFRLMCAEDETVIFIREICASVRKYMKTFRKFLREKNLCFGKITTKNSCFRATINAFCTVSVEYPDPVNVTYKLNGVKKRTTRSEMVV
jgi:hypothetical protein